jgi:transcriptional regulator with XRE-family HTH domain
MTNEVETLVRQIFDDADRYGIHAYEVANRAGVSANGISYWRNGRTKPSLESYLKVRRAADELIVEKSSIK